MQQCKFCGSTLPTYAHFCTCCGHVVDDLNQGTTYFSSPPKLDVQTPEAITPPVLNDPSHQFVSDSAMGQGDLDATLRLQRYDEGNMLDDRYFGDRHTEEDRAVLPGMMLLATQMGEGQAPVGNVPMVQGTPHVSDVPAVQGTPAMPAHPPGAQALYHNAPASAPAAPSAPSWVPHTSPPSAPPAHHPHHHLRPRRRHVPRPHGIAQHLLIAAVAVIVIATSAVTGALAIFRPALSLSVNGGITPGGTLQLHGVNFTPGSSVTLTLDHGIPLSSIGHGDLGEASYGAGFANVLQMSVSAEHSLQATAPGTSIPVSIQGTFDVTIQVGQNWSAGVHTIHATDRVLGRTADLQFAIPSAQAKLVVTPSSVLDFGSLEIGRKVALPVIVGNMGGRQLHWTADVGSTPWLQVQPASGTMLPGNHEQVVNIVANTSNLAAKDYSAVLHISSDAGEARIVVKLKVIPPGSSAKAILDVNPASLDFGTQAVGTQVTMNVTLANTGTQALSWGADMGNASWLKLSSSSGKILPGGLPQTMNVTADTTQLAAGKHSAMLNITSDGGNKQVAVTVVVTGALPTPTVTTPITSPAVLAMNPPGLDFGAMDPNTTKTLPEIVKNTGGQPLTWNSDTTKLPGWLSVDTSSGTVQLGSQQTINVTANTSNLSPGPYSATLNFTSNGGNASVSVTLAVNMPKPPLQRILTSQQTQSQTVNATGQGTTPGTQATGSILIGNGDLKNPLNLPAGTILTNTQGCTGQGLQVSLDSNVYVPAYNNNGPWPTTTVSIHVVQPGVTGNIQDCSSTDHAFLNFTYTFEAKNLSGGFTGGTDPQSYTTVQQSDIDTAANSLKASTGQSALADLNSQLRPNEHLVGNPQCTYNTTSDHAAGDQATTVTVTVMATCTATAST